MVKRPIPVIIDTDPGVDDAIALMLAASSDKLNIVGVTAVDGNVKYELTFQNARNLVSFFKIACPVAKGATTQLERPCTLALTVHGKKGLGNLELPDAEEPFSDLPAWDFIYEKALEFQGELEIMAIAPLTNLAKLFQKHPDVVPYIKRIVSMGGSMWLGNRSKYAEFNYWVDPAAAEIVFKSGVPITMIGLNVTMASGIPLRLIDSLTEKQTKYSLALKRLLESYEDYYPNKNCEDAVTVHDAIAAAYMINPACCKAQEGAVRICTDESQYGRSLVRFGTPEMFNCLVVTDVDMACYENMLVDMMQHYERLEI